MSQTQKDAAQQLSETTEAGESVAHSHNNEKAVGRFAFIDGLRGLAALGVVVFHAWWYEPEPRALLVDAEWSDLVFLRARAGVQILLVISGFVIAYTLRNTWVTPREFLSFMTRRIVRLVPAYWIALSFALLMGMLCHGPLQITPPFDDQVSATRVLAHLVFLQDVLGFKSFSAGLWTVCIEMQFYVLAVVGWGAAQRILARPTTDKPQPAATALLLVFGPLAIISLVFCYRVECTEPWVIYFMWRFCLGMAAWWTLERTIPLRVFATMVIIGTGQLVFELTLDPLFDHENEFPSANFIGLATALAIYGAGRTGRIHQWLNWTWLQFVGRISYSVYLIHYPVIYVLTNVGWKWCGNSPSTIQAAGILVSSTAVSLLAGYVLYMTVEAPSFRWAAKLKRPSNTRVGKSANNS